MILFRHEMKRGIRALIIWTAAIVFMLIVCIVIYPDMKSEIASMSDMFANMGSFTAAFGMEQINFATLIGFYGIECGNILGIGGGFFAAYIGISALSKEESAGTADFLLTHPVSRIRVTAAKLASVAAQILILNAIILGAVYLSVLAVGEELDVTKFLLMHLAYLILQLEIAGICFGISAFIRRSGTGIGLGLSAVLYFMNIIGNLSEKAEFVKYITPFKYAESAGILESGRIDTVPLVLGVIYALIFVTAAFYYYGKKDIA